MIKFLKIISVLLIAHSTQLRAQNSMSLSSAEAAPQGVVEIELSVTNTDSFVAFQTEIPLGENLSYVANSAVLYRSVDHQMVASVVNGTLKLYAFSLSGKAFSGNEGKVATFQLRIGNEPGGFPLNHTKAKLVNAAGNELPLTTYNGSVNVLTPKIEIRTPQLNYGHVPIRSTYNKTLTVKNVGNMPLTISGLQFSDATLSCPSFTEKVLSAGSSASFTIVYSPVTAGEVNYSVTVVSDASNGNQTAKVIADPYSVNELRIVSTSGYCDSIVDVNVKVNNMDAITGFQFCIKMPSALQYQTNGFELSSRKTDHVGMASMRNDTLVLVAYSPTNSSFNGDDGVIASFKVKIKGTSGNHYLYPNKVILTDTQAHNVMSDSYSGYVSVSSPKISVSSTVDLASSSITEVIQKDFRITNNGKAPLRIDSVKFNDSYLSCLTEFPLVINNYGNANITISCNRTAEGDFKSTMRIYSNDPTNGLQLVKVNGSRYEPNGLSIDNEAVVSDKYLDVLVNMDNYSEITALQVDFSYPNEYYNLQSSDISLTERCQGFSLTSVPINDSTFKIIMFSMSNAIISGNEGAVLKIRLNRNLEMQTETATVSLKNIILSDVKGNNKDSEGNQIKKIDLLTTDVRELKQGWNWYSTNLNINGTEGLDALKEALGDNAQIIKSMTEFTLYYEEQGIWDGSLDMFNNKTFYMINMSNPINIELRGFLTDMDQYEIIIKKGWNWINYSNNEEISIDETDFGFTPSDGDVIKSQTKFAKYYEGYGWDGSLEILQTGDAYMYFSNDDNDKIMSFNKF
ncbi:MAG: choice-of-anchor D domain-containing protein [Bacteroidales bacterium]|nr:choice-of-anchor D domain-containing protein [Bacteroidales bacterium]